MSYIWMSHVTHMSASRHKYGWTISHTWMSHVTHRRMSYQSDKHTDVTHLSHVTRMNTSCITWICHVTNLNLSCHTYGNVMSHLRTSHVTHLSASCYTYHVTCMDESRPTYEWVMSHTGACVNRQTNRPYNSLPLLSFAGVWVSHVTHMDESCHTFEIYHMFECVTCHVAFPLLVSLLIRVCGG